MLNILSKTNSETVSWHETLSAERRAQLCLIRTENVGPVTFYALLKNFGSAINALQELPRLSLRGGRQKPLVAYTEQQLNDELLKIDDFGAGLLFWDEKAYPSLFRMLSDAPPVICYRGNLELLKKPIVGMVGARNASLIGKQFAEKIAGELGSAGYVTISGLARGIDTAVHKGSIQKGTIAAIAGGINIVYPPENQNLHNDIAQQGLIITESAFDVMPHATLFPRRNRLISGLSQGVIIIEAALKSGSLLTAQYAIDQHREVFVVPGHPMDPRAQGGNKLIQEGAALIQSVDDVLTGLQQLKERRITFVPQHHHELQETFSSANTYSAEDLAPLRQMIFENLNHVPVTMDELIRACQTSGRDVLMVVVELELAGRIVRYPGNKLALTTIE